MSKEETYKLIDEVPGNRVLILTYNGTVGVSEHGKYIKKKSKKRLINQLL